MALVALVAARAEGHVAFAGQQHAADRRVVADAAEGVDQLAHGLRSERIAYLRPGDRDLGDAGPGVLVADVLVVLDRGPVDGGGGHRAGSSSRNDRTRRWKAAGVSRCGACPDPTIASNRASAIPVAIADARRQPIWSPAPATTSVGHRTSRTRSKSGSMLPCPAPRRLAARPFGRLRIRLARRAATRAGGIRSV